MKRRNVQEAFIGEPSGSGTSDAHMDNYADGDEAVDIEVRKGMVQVVVPAGTSDESLFESGTFLGGEVVLEDGRVLTFQIQGGAVGAQFAVESRPSSDDAEGLSTLPTIPSGT